MKFAILGQGAYGEALGQILTENGHRVAFYDPKKSDLTLEKALQGAKAMILAVPSTEAPELLAQLPKRKTLVVATKGILDFSLFEGFTDMIVMSGPSFAEDIKKHQKAAWTVTDERIDKWFWQDWMYMDWSDDCEAVLICGALKNVYAIEAGRRGLEPHSDRLRAMTEQAVWEMGRLLYISDRDAPAALSACGVGDLIASCGPGSRNYEFGLRLRKDPNYRPEHTVEGLSTLKQLREGVLEVPAEARILRRIIERVK